MVDKKNLARQDNARLAYIDFLKFIGLSCIIIAHIGAPVWLLTLRSFDVPLMVIISSLLGFLSFKKNKFSKNIIWVYYFARFKRLVMPVWIFLTIYFLLVYVIWGKVYDIEYYIASYCLTRYGIGYVWIILIYLYSAMLIPLFDRLKPTRNNIIIILLVYVFYEIIYCSRLCDGYKIIDTTLFYIIPYGVLTYIGFYFDRLNPKQRLILAVGSSIVFILVGFVYWYTTGDFQKIQIAKYPVRLYYLSYGISCSSWLLLVCKNSDSVIFSMPLIRYIS